MKKVCLYFQVHQPFRTNNYSVFSIGNDHKYFDHDKNMRIASKVADQCYLPANKLMLDLIRKHQGKFKVAFGISGVALDQMEEYTPQVIDTFKALADTGCVEFLGETYHHSLSFFYSKEEFLEQVRMHDQKIQNLFGMRPTVFRNSELVFNNELAAYAESMGYKGIVSNGTPQALGWRSPNYVYNPTSTKSIKLLLKNVGMSEDIEHRFSDESWNEWPMTSRKMAGWLGDAEGEVVNLFMDYEALGEHHKKDSGIFTFMKQLPDEILKNHVWATPGEIVESVKSAGELDVHLPISGNNLEGIRALLGNNLQHAAINRIYQLEKGVKASNDPELIDHWRKMQSTDHFHYMATGISKNHSPHGSPYDSFIAYMNIVNDLQLRLKQPVTPIAK